MPIAAPIGDRYGPRGNTIHAGLDFPAPTGTTVRSRRARPRDLRGLRLRLGPRRHGRSRRLEDPLRASLPRHRHPGRGGRRRANASASSARPGSPPARTCTSRSSCGARTWTPRAASSRVERAAVAVEQRAPRRQDTIREAQPRSGSQRSAAPPISVAASHSSTTRAAPARVSRVPCHGHGVLRGHASSALDRRDRTTPQPEPPRLLVRDAPAHWLTPSKPISAFAGPQHGERLRCRLRLLRRRVHVDVRGATASATASVHLLAISAS